MTTWTRYKQTAPLCDICLNRGVLFLEIERENKSKTYICEDCTKTIKDFYKSSYLEKEELGPRTATYELSSSDGKIKSADWYIPMHVYDMDEGRNQGVDEV